MDDKDFDKIVDRAIDSLPEEFKEKLSNVNVVVADIPSPLQLSKVSVKGLLLGLYEGVPQTRRGNYGVGGVLPDKITIFKSSLLRISTNVFELEQNVRKTVIHEIGHHFGLSEEDLVKAANS